MRQVQLPKAQTFLSLPLYNSFSILTNCVNVVQTHDKNQNMALIYITYSNWIFYYCAIDSMTFNPKYFLEMSAPH